MSELYIVPLDLGDIVWEKSASYLRRLVGQKDPGKIVASYIGGAKANLQISLLHEV